MSFDFQPTLKGELLELRPLRAEDFHDLYAAALAGFEWDQGRTGAAGRVLYTRSLPRLSRD